ncbi:MAG: hypothetical protein AB7P23_13665, partial [Amphiplicatus sp.]
MARAKRGKTLSLAQDVAGRIERAWGESPFYQAQLKGPAPDRLLCQPTDPRTPDRALGEALLKGRLTFGAESVDCEGEIERIWDLACAPGPLHSFLHEFSWLRHLDALGEGGTGPARARTRAGRDRFGKWSPDAGAPALAAERLSQRCGHSALRS